MAEGLEIREKSIRVQLYGVRWTVQGKPTKTQQQHVAKQRREIKSRIDLGEDIHNVLEEYYGDKQKRAESLGYYAQHFLDVVAPGEVTHSTLLDYQSAYNAHWLQWDHVPINKIKLTELQRELSGKNLSKKRQKNVVSVLRRIFDCAVGEALETNPIDRWELKWSKTDERPGPDPYSAKDQALLLKHLSTSKDLTPYRFFLMAFGSGMRTGELLAARWENYSTPLLQVSQQVVRRRLVNHTKTGLTRSVILTPTACDMLESTAPHSRKGFIFLNTKDGMLKDADVLMKAWKDAHEATKVRVRETLYPWRSTYISTLISGGVNINDVARLAGNSPQMIEKHYLDYLPNDEREARLIGQVHEIIPRSSPETVAH